MNNKVQITNLFLGKINRNAIDPNWANVFTGKTYYFVSILNA